MHSQYKVIVNVCMLLYLSTSSATSLKSTHGQEGWHSTPPTQAGLDNPMVEGVDKGRPLPLAWVLPPTQGSGLMTQLSLLLGSGMGRVI